MRYLQAVSDRLLVQGFADLVKDSSADEEKKLGAKASARKSAKGIANVEGRRIVEDEIDFEANGVGASELQAGCRFAIGAGFFWLANMGTKISGFPALCRGITVMLTGLAVILINAAGRVTDAMADVNDTVAAVGYLLDEEVEPGVAPPSLVAPEAIQGIDKSSRRLRLLGALVAPDDSGHADVAAAARPWRWDWALKRDARVKVVPKPTGESGRAAVVAAERRGDDISAAAAKATLAVEEVVVALKAGAQCWVLPDEAASAAKGSTPSVASKNRRAMLVIDNEDGTWNVVCWYTSNPLVFLIFRSIYIRRAFTNHNMQRRWVYFERVAIEYRQREGHGARVAGASCPFAGLSSAIFPGLTSDLSRVCVAGGRGRGGGHCCGPAGHGEETG